MGLASYGEPTYLDQFRRIVHSSGLGTTSGSTTSATTSRVRR